MLDMYTLKIAVKNKIKNKNFKASCEDFCEVAEAANTFCFSRGGWRIVEPHTLSAHTYSS